MKHKFKFILFLSVLCGVLYVAGILAQTQPLRQETTILARFNDGDVEWNKVTIDLIRKALSKQPNGWAYIRVKDDKGLIRRLQKLRKASVLQKLNESRLTYLVGDAGGYDTESFFAEVGKETNLCERCVAIRAVDFDSLDRLFRIRRIARRN